jgi:hypothetical protein
MDRFVERFISDRRLARRHNLKAPLRLRIRKSIFAEQQVQIENLSRCGVFFSTDLPLHKGASLDLLMEVPEEIAGIPHAHWLCTGHVVRVVPVTGRLGQNGIAVQFDCYEVSRPEPSASSFGSARVESDLKKDTDDSFAH